MYLIFEAEAGQFHLHQISHGSNVEALRPTVRLSNLRNCFEVFRPHFFRRENKVDCASRFRISRVDEHVHAGDVPIFQSEQFGHVAYAINVGAAHGYIDIACQARVNGTPRVDVNVRRQTADDLIWNCSCFQGSGEPLRRID